MDWTNPVTSLAILAATTTVGTILWKVFWWVAKIDPLPKGFEEIRKDIREIFRRLPPPRAIGNGSPARLTEHGQAATGTLGVRC